MRCRRLAASLLGAWLLAACAPSAPSEPTAAPPRAAANSWDQVVAAARQEGRVSVIGPQGSESAELLTRSFQARYPDIQVEFNGMAGGQIGPKVLGEVAANRSTTDLIITGTTTAIETLQPANALEPVPPHLIGPNDRDPSVWRDGKLDFADSSGQYDLVFSSYIKAPFVYNPTLVNPEEFSSYRDLLDPRWKGKLVWRDPRQAGGGLAVVTFFYTSEALGKEYIRDLFTQDITVSTNDQQVMDWVARGQYPIALGPSDTLANDYVARGLPVKHMETARLKEGGYVTAGNGSLVVVKGPPHPNALKVYLDWLLSKDGQTEWTKSQGFPSERKDVPTDSVLPLLVPQPGVTYQQNHAERYVKLRGEIVAFLNTVMP
jgi:iron(III) transport system substrate-binding protein